MAKYLVGAGFVVVGGVAVFELQSYLENKKTADEEVDMPEAPVFTPDDPDGVGSTNDLTTYVGDFSYVAGACTGDATNPLGGALAAKDMTNKCLSGIASNIAGGDMSTTQAWDVLSNSPGVLGFYTSSQMGRAAGLKDANGDFISAKAYQDGTMFQGFDYKPPPNLDPNAEGAGTTWGLSPCIDTNFWTRAKDGSDNQVQRVCSSLGECANVAHSNGDQKNCAVASVPKCQGDLYTVENRSAFGSAAFLDDMASKDPTKDSPGSGHKWYQHLSMVAGGGTDSERVALGAFSRCQSDKGDPLLNQQNTYLKFYGTKSLQSYYNNEIAKASEQGGAYSMFVGTAADASYDAFGYGSMNTTTFGNQAKLDKYFNPCAVADPAFAKQCQAQTDARKAGSVYGQV